MFSNKSNIAETTVTKDDIIRYFDECEEHYRKFWHLNHCMAMHAGFWYANTKSLKEALINENKILAALAEIDSSDYVLDAGCGVGGSSVFLAENYGCKVKGITLSQKQANTANEFAKEKQITEIVNFEVQDFTDTTFENQSFNVVWGIESVCYANNKKDFIQEAYRLLKPKGRIIVADGFNNRDHFQPKEEKLMNEWLKGWGVNELVTKEYFQKGLQEAGFHNIKVHDFTQQVMPSSKKLFMLSYPALWMAKLGKPFKRHPSVLEANLISARAQYRALKQGLWKYLVISAVKK